MDEADEPVDLVGLEHVDPGRGQDPDGQQGNDDPEATTERCEVLPADPGEEERSEGGARVDERGAEVRLEEDEQDRASAAIPIDREHDAPRLERPRARGEVARRRTRSGDLPELRGLELEERRGRSSAATRGRPSPTTKTTTISASASAEQDVAGAAGGARGRAAVMSDERDHAEDDEDRLRSDEVARVVRERRPPSPPGRSRARRRRAPPRPRAAGSRDGEGSRPTSRAEPASALRRAPCRRSSAGSPSVGLPSSICGDGTPHHSSNTFSATGAATSPPWPPFSITAQTTSGGSRTAGRRPSARSRTTRTGPAAGCRCRPRTRGIPAGTDGTARPCPSCRRSGPDSRRTRCTTCHSSRRASRPRAPPGSARTSSGWTPTSLAGFPANVRRTTGVCSSEPRGCSTCLTTCGSTSLPPFAIRA